MNEKNVRTVHTGLYSKKAKEIIDSVFGQMSDGMWENSNVMNKYWMFANTQIRPDGEIVLAVSNECSKRDYNKWIENGFRNMSDAEILEFIGKKIKQIARQELKDENVRLGWKRDNFETELCYLNYDEHVSVADAYFVYEFLLARPVIGTSKYSEDFVNSVIGKRRNGEETLAAEERWKRLGELEMEFTASYRALNAEKAAALKKLDAEFSARLQKLFDEYNVKRKPLSEA